MFEHLGPQFVISEDQYEYLKDWIYKNVFPRKTYNPDMTSYNIQRRFEISENGFYATNEIIKSAMVECGFRVRNKRELNWVFNISSRSPIFKLPH